jgi:iron complex transport system substrate-binding protein
LLLVVLTSCGSAGKGVPPAADVSGAQTEAASQNGPYTTLVSDFRNADLGCGWEPTDSMELRYARCFTVDYFADGYALACMADGNRYLIVPADGAVPEGLSADIQVIQAPVADVYLAASDSLCLFDALGTLDSITVSGIERDDWYLEAARAAMDSGAMVFGGKYRAPDYELLVDKGVRLAVESTMVNHVPEVREKLMELGIPVLVELSSYEDEPLGRAEWVRLYGLLCNRDERAQAVFDEQVDKVGALEAKATGKTVAFFYLNASGSAVVRRPGDYVTKMIAQAGGTYAFGDVEQARAGSSSTTMEMERFYAAAKDADVIIYNATIDDGVGSLVELLDKNELLADFAAVKRGDVWITDRNMYQQMIATGDIIADIGRVLRGATEDQTYLRRLL